MSMVGLSLKISMPHSIQAHSQISTSPIIGPLIPTRNSMLPPSVRGYPWAGAALQCSLLMATTSACTPEDSLQHSPTLPTFHPLITMHILFLLQSQPLQSSQMIIPLFDCHSLLKSLLRPDSSELKPTSSSAMKSSASSGAQSKALPLIPHQQEELNAASNILRNLNPMGGLFDQPAIHT
ncbi:hypothetical protein C0989_001342 [Termitomyces sp. Mn162]|nr:hypothetical protein C0989_001342 [Termitomyces sp. Mn162]